jgi:hypothetical protein
MKIEVSIDAQIIILQGLVEEVNQGLFRMTCVYNAHERVGAKAEQLENLKHEIARLEGLNMHYNKQLEEIIGTS